MPSDDLKNYATSSTNFYELLSLPENPSQSEIDRAWRRTALKYHPDKVGASDTVAREKFHLAQIGYDILSDPAIKSIYDNARTAREQKRRQNELFEGKRRKMKEDLEGRERGFKRARDEEAGEQEAFERKLRQLAEDGKRRRQEREGTLRAEMAAEQKRQAESDENGPQTPRTLNGAAQPQSPAEGLTTVSEIDRSVKVRWALSATPQDLTTDQLRNLFSRFGLIENAFLLKTKLQRLELQTPTRRKKEPVGTCVLVFTSIVGAHTAVEDAKKQTGDPWPAFDSVFWAANKEPDFVRSDGLSESSSPSSPAKTPLSTPVRGAAPSFLRVGAHPGTPPSMGAGKNGTGSGDGLRKVPSFGSFMNASRGGISTPKNSGTRVAGSPNLEEMTMIRLRNAEKRRLEAEIRRADEEAEMRRQEGVEGTAANVGV